jgi:L-alanine-DL-glutamate epimerase-like enolase superfamily enzyme
MARQLDISVERFPIAGAFVIARGAKTEAQVVVATINDGAHAGRGECVPYARYGESLDSVVAAIGSVRSAIEAGADRVALQDLLAAGAARNALDCALWDLEAKSSGMPAYRLAGLDRIAPATTAYTISVGSPETMAAATRTAAHRPLLKIKLGGTGDAERLAAVRDAAPDATLIVDANEAWTEHDLDAHFAACAAAGIALVEQPLPAGRDATLARRGWPVPVCADESVHARKDLAALADRYDLVNIKLDKAGGLTEALAMVGEAQRLGLGIMVGCMVGTSLAMAPAMLLACHARFVDLDGPLLLARDRQPALRYEGSLVFPPDPALWG